MCEISIRTMTVQDYPLFDVMESALHRMHQQARPDLFAELAHPCSRAEFSQMIQDSHRELFLAEWKGKPAGMCDLLLCESSPNPILLPQKSAHVDDILVMGEFRRKGVGTALYEEALCRAKRFGAEHLELMVWAFNESARKFYEKCGMTLRSFVMDMKLEGETT